MSEKEFERNLDYGDCNNIFCFISSLFKDIVVGVENNIIETKKIIDNSLKIK